MPKKKRKVDKTVDKIKSHKVCMSTKNGQRWISLKNNLGFLMDDEVADYLLGLADSMIDQDKGSQISHGKLRGSRKLKDECREKPETLLDSLENIEKFKSSLRISDKIKKQTKFHKVKHKRKNANKSNGDLDKQCFIGERNQLSDNVIDQSDVVVVGKSLEFDQSLANDVAQDMTENEKDLCHGAIILSKESHGNVPSHHDINDENLENNAEITSDDCEFVSNNASISTTVVKDTQSEINLESLPPEPELIMEDSTSLSTWRTKHKNALAKVTNSEDPMSRGYVDLFEDKQEDINPHWPLFSRESLPACLKLKITINTDHGLGVFAKNHLPKHTQFGPLLGQYVQEMDIPDDYSMKHIWEISANNKTRYLSTTDPLKSNWIRYMRPAETEDSKTVQLVEKSGQVFFITCKTLTPGNELIYWLDSNSWTRKVDKTNCGGCNLKFSHQFYYRLHCSIFHDTNYSLTIRKYHCKVCGSAVLGKDNIMKHAAQFHAGRGAYQCQYCKKFFLRLNYLEMHRTYGCSRNPARSRPLCDFCGRKFCQPQKLKVHIKRMHSETAQILEEFQCKSCCKLLGSRAALQRHMKEVHHKDVLAACDRCGKTFQNKSNLKIHMLTHSGVKPFKCKEIGCKAAFTTKQCLQFHYKKVHGLSDEMMPKIERSIAYTLDAYSGCTDHDKENSLDDDGSDAVDSSGQSEAETIESPERSAKIIEIRRADRTCELDIQSETVAGANDQFHEPSPYRVSIQTDDEKHLETSSPKRQESFNASLLVEAALDAAERDIGVVSIPPCKEQQESMYSSELGFKSAVCYQAEAANLESYDELAPCSSSINPNFRQVLTASSLQYRPTYAPSNRLHSVEQYLEHDIPTPPRYDESSHNAFQMQAVSDDSDSAVQNLSLPVKDTSIQQQQMAKYTYTSSVNKAKFVIVQSEQGLDMSARGFHQTCDFQNSNHHYHSHHPYKGVDLSISGPGVSPPSYSTIYPSYSHIDVPRVANLESTSRSLHAAVSRIVSSPLPAENIPASLSSDASQVLPSSESPAAAIPTFNAIAHHTSRSGYHYCNYY